MGEREEQIALFRDMAEQDRIEAALRRRPIYADVEEILSHGHLTKTVSHQGVDVVFRSLDNASITRLLARSSGANADTALWYVVSSMWLVNGHEVADDQVPDIYRYFHKRATPASKDVLLAAVNALARRVSVTIKLVEAFCYEDYNRYLWKLLGEPREWGRTGNIVRQKWVRYNLTEDEIDQQRAAWERTIQLVAASASKRAERLRENHQTNLDRRKEEREEAIRKILIELAHGPQEEKPVVVTVNGQQIQVVGVRGSMTVADLEADMRRQFIGEKDLHDYGVQRWTETVRRGREQKLKEIEEARALFRQAVADEVPEDNEPKFLSREEAEARSRRNSVKPPRMPSEVGEYLFDRYLSRDIPVGIVGPNWSITPVTPEAPAAEGNPQKPIDLDSRKPRIE